MPGTPHLWLLALIPVGLAIVPLSKLTILLLLVLALDLTVALLLVQDFRLRPARSGAPSDPEFEPI